MWLEVVQVIESENIKKNDRKGNENCFELAGSLNYRGFELQRVKL